MTDKNIFKKCLVELDNPIAITMDYPLADCPDCKMVILVNAISPYGSVISQEQIIAYILSKKGQSTIWRFNLS